jgi:hypothetical protein
MHDVTRRNQRRVDCGDYMDRDCPDRAYFVHKFPWWSLNLFMFRRCVLLWIPSLCATTARLPPISCIIRSMSASSTKKPWSLQPPPGYGLREPFLVAERAAFLLGSNALVGGVMDQGNKIFRRHVR